MKQMKRKTILTLTLVSIVAIFTACKSLGQGQHPALTPAQQRLKDLGQVLVVDAVPNAEMLAVEFFADKNDHSFFQKSSVKLKNKSFLSGIGSSVIPETVRVIWRTQWGETPAWWYQIDSRDDFGERIPNYSPPIRKKKPTIAELLQKKIEKRKIVAKNIGYEHQGPWGGDYFGQAAGDYTVNVASRIPDDVVTELLKRGGSLRLKFRLKPDGVLFGWDIERISGGLPKHSMAGGDFREAEPANELPVVHIPYSSEAKPYLETGEYFVPSDASLIWRRGWYIDSKTSQKILTDF